MSDNKVWFTEMEVAELQQQINAYRDLSTSLTYEDA